MTTHLHFLFVGLILRYYYHCALWT